MLSRKVTLPYPNCRKTRVAFHCLVLLVAALFIPGAVASSGMLSIVKSEAPFGEVESSQEAITCTENRAQRRRQPPRPNSLVTVDHHSSYFVGDNSRRVPNSGHRLPCSYTLMAPLRL
jgi:hypothetical protein